MENTYQDKRSRKLSIICQLLQTVYKELQLYSKTSQQIKRQKRLEMGRRTAEDIWGVKGEDNKSTGSCSSKKRGKILSRNWRIGTCNRSSLIIGTRWQIETYHILIKNNITGKMKLWDIW